MKKINQEVLTTAICQCATSPISGLGRFAHRISHVLVAGLAMLAFNGALAQTSPNGLDVSIPNGFATIYRTDMQLSSTAGPVSWQRTWDGSEWRFNRHWESLSQSWRNLTGSQTADSMGSPGNTGSTVGGSNCFVSVSDGWLPGNGNAEAPPLSAQRATPFNLAMSDQAGGDYAAPQRVMIDPATLCAGVAGAGTANEVEGIRRINALYLGEAGRYAFDNRTTLEKRAVRQLPQASEAAVYASLSSGNMVLRPEQNAKGFRWTDKGGDWIDYNTQGQVVAWGNANNNTVWMVRDTSGVLRGVLDANGRVLFSLHYTGQLLTEVRDYPIAGLAQDLPARSVKYAYDAKNRLRQVTDVRGFVVTYEYNSKNQLTQITDQENRVEKLAYLDNLVKQRTAPDSGVTDYSFGYDDVNKQFVSNISYPETAAGRRVEGYTHNRTGAMLRKVVNGRIDAEFSYDPAARSASRTNARGFTSRSISNEFGQAVEVVNTDNSVTKNSYSALHLKIMQQVDEAGFKTRYAYDANFNLKQRIEAADTPEQRVTNYEINDLGQVFKSTRVGRTEANGTVTPDAVWQMEYDAQGQVKKTTDPEGKVRHYVYDRAGNLVQYTDPRNYTSRYEVDAMGYLLKSTDGLLRVSRFEYDKVGNQVKTIDARAKTMLYAYDAMNRVKESTNQVNGVAKVQYNLEGLPETTTDEDDRMRRSEFDNFLRLSRQMDGVGNVTEYGYHVADGTSNGVLGGLKSPTEIKYPTYTQKSRFDQRERPVSTTLINPNGQGNASLNTTAAYDQRGLVKDQTDAYGKANINAYNALGQPSELKDRLGHQTKMLYDARGNLIQVTDTLNHSYKYEYDRNNRVVKEVLPLGQTTTYQYDDAGNLKERLDPNGHKTSYDFDASNRLVEMKQYQRGVTLVRTISYTLDDNDNLIGWRDIDHSLNQTASATAAFDDANRKTSETVTYPAGNTMAYGYEYTLAGLKKQLTWPDGSKIAYGYTQHGVLESVTIPNEGIMSVNQFKWFAPEKITLPGGTVQSKTYDGVLNLESVNVKTPAQQTVLSITNTYGKALELKQSNRSDTLGSNSLRQDKRYSFDDEIRLTQVEAEDGRTTTVESFTLDGVSNRVVHSRQTGDWVFDENNRLKKRGSGVCGDVGTVCYEYDEAGNTTKKIDGAKVTQFVYNTMNQLVAVKDGADRLIARYGYDPLFRRMWKEQFRDIGGSVLAQAKRTYFLYADEGLIGEAVQDITLNSNQTVTVNGSAVINTQYGPTPNAPFTTGVLFVKTKNSNNQDVVAYYQHDHLNTPMQATDKMGNVVWAASYDAFGRVQITTPVATEASPTIVSNLRLPGQYEDVETGLYYNFHRVYDPENGRYLQSDPIKLNAGINTYSYVNGNPLDNYDPNGLWTWGDPLPQGLVDFSAGMGDALSFGITNEIRNLMDTNGAVNKCSGAYSAGGWTGVAVGAAIGGIGAAGTRGPGQVFSHWIPARIFRPSSPSYNPIVNRVFGWAENTILNGNYVSRQRHFKHDPFAYGTFRGEHLAWGDKWAPWLQQLDRIPNVYAGAGIVGGAIAISKPDPQCECN